ncbi:hypothetical protein KP509_06G024200 [Ceratopteris richardii]|uniref:Uncharacterized protein n=1 Tax=Ceratopteris richardii TaxID=49495 RepID=A0A8T2UJ72_CERRI|nr:hypothetical protein KP509_06G024200 [Ceratopteris richardii]
MVFSPLRFPTSVTYNKSMSPIAAFNGRSSGVGKHASKLTQDLSVRFGLAYEITFFETYRSIDVNFNSSFALLLLSKAWLTEPSCLDYIRIGKSSLNQTLGLLESSAYCRISHALHSILSHERQSRVETFDNDLTGSNSQERLTFSMNPLPHVHLSQNQLSGILSSVIGYNQSLSSF